MGSRGKGKTVEIKVTERQIKGGLGKEGEVNEIEGEVIAKKIGIT